LVLEAPKARRKLLGASAEPGIFRKSLEAPIQSVAVAAGLLDTELFYAAIGDFVNVSSRATR